MPVKFEIISIAIWAVPLLILGFFFGSGWLKKIIPTSGCVLMIIGWVAGIATLMAIALAFPIQFAALIAQIEFDRLINNGWGQTTFFISPWIIMIVVIVVLSVIIAKLYDRAMRLDKPQ